MTATNTSVDDPKRRSTDLLRACLAIEVHPESHFGAVSHSTAAEVVAHELKPDHNGSVSADATCHTLVARGTDQQEYIVTDATEHCVSPVFSTADCLATPQSIRDGMLTVRVTAPSEARFEQVIDQLQRRVSAVSVEWLLNGDSDHRATEVEVTRVTEKQTEAIETALELGYYERPRRATLGDLADELGVTDSAVSQRLNGAERNLVKSLFETETQRRK